MKITPTGKVLGATIEDLDVSRPLSHDAFNQVVHALGEHGVIRFPDQELTGQLALDHALHSEPSLTSTAADCELLALSPCVRAIPTVHSRGATGIPRGNDRSTASPRLSHKCSWGQRFSP